MRLTPETPRSLPSSSHYEHLVHLEEPGWAAPARSVGSRGHGAGSCCGQAPLQSTANATCCFPSWTRPKVSTEAREPQNLPTGPHPGSWLFCCSRVVSGHGKLSLCGCSLGSLAADVCAQLPWQPTAREPTQARQFDALSQHRLAREAVQQGPGPPGSGAALQLRFAHLDSQRAATSGPWAEPRTRTTEEHRGELGLSGPRPHGEPSEAKWEEWQQAHATLLWKHPEQLAPEADKSHRILVRVRPSHNAG